MRGYQSEESHIRKVFQSMVELLFQDIPFSRKAEEAKERICDKLQGLWEKRRGGKKSSGNGGENFRKSESVGKGGNFGRIFERRTGAADSKRRFEG